MYKKIIIGVVMFCLFLVASVGAVANNSISSFSDGHQRLYVGENQVNGYGIQWQKEYSSLPWLGGRFEGPQPIGDCDNDGMNEFLIGGRDSNLRVMEWDEKDSYLPVLWKEDGVCSLFRKRTLA